MTYKEFYTKLIEEIINSDIPDKEYYIQVYTKKIKDKNWN